jgi:hypothetical protein
VGAEKRMGVVRKRKKKEKRRREEEKKKKKKKKRRRRRIRSDSKCGEREGARVEPRVRKKMSWV